MKRGWVFNVDACIFRPLGAIIKWSLSNYSYGWLRNKYKQHKANSIITSAPNHVRYDGNVITIDDSICNVLDVVGVNEYLGWYVLEGNNFFTAKSRFVGRGK
ncbi:MAG: hypothetical protein M3015_04120 [Bacteroidota bacterium]|nr:hypothetical protein [Bacteroidota bacterium]